MKQHTEPGVYAGLVDGPAQSGKSRRRLPWLAALLSLMLPGFGQLYNAQVNRAIWFFLVFCLFTVPFIVLVALFLPPAMTAPLLVLSSVLAAAVWLGGALDAARQALRINRSEAADLPKAWQRSGLYVLVFLVGSMLVLPVAISWVKANLVQAFRIPTGSMQPTLQPGDYLFADMRYNCPGCAHEVLRGDVAIFVYPDNRNRYYVKRVIGLPGDRVSLSGKTVEVNGKALDKPADRAEGGPRADAPGLRAESIGQRQWLVRWGKPQGTPVEVVVKPGHVFVLGDNRNETTDSRHFGQVPLADVIGLARQVWLSIGPDGVRWQRIGQDVGFGR